MVRGDAESLDVREPVVLVNIGREWHNALTPDQLYERTHGFWCCNPENHSAKYAISVAKGLVRQVYRIRGWHKVNVDTIKMDPTRIVTVRTSKQRVRWYFDGDLSPELQHYVGKSVKHYRSHGNANPIIWLNCPKPERQAGIMR